MATAAPAIPRMNEFFRLLNLAWNPAQTFRDVLKRPHWIVPLLLTTMFSLSVTFTIAQRVGWDNWTRARIAESDAGKNMSVSELEMSVHEWEGTVRTLAYLYGSLGTLTQALVLSCAMYVAFSAGCLTFRQVFAVVCYSLVPQAVSAVTAAIVAMLREPSQIVPGSLILLSIGSWLDPANKPAWLMSLLFSADLIDLATALLLAAGFWVAGRGRSYRGTLAYVVALWLGWILLKAIVIGNGAFLMS